MTELAFHLLSNARFLANTQRGLPDAKQSDELIAESFAAFIEDVQKALGGLSYGAVRLKPRHQVMAPKEQRRPIDALPEERVSK